MKGLNVKINPKHDGICFTSLTNGNYDHSIGTFSNASMGSIIDTTVQTDPKREFKIKKILSADILRKYNLVPDQGNSKRLHNYSIDVLRSLLVFGDHKHIIDTIRAKSTGSLGKR